MKRVLKKHEELAFTFVAYGFLLAVLMGFLAVRTAREASARHRGAPAVLSLEPRTVVPGASQRVKVFAARSNFGPRTTVHSADALVTNIRFASEREMTFDVYVEDRGECLDGRNLSLAILSPTDDGEERVPIALRLSDDAEPLELDLHNFGDHSLVTVPGGEVLFGYRPRGYAPFHFEAHDLEAGRGHAQVTERELEHLGVVLEPGEHPFELRLSDALGREVRKRVTVVSIPRSEAFFPGTLASYAAFANYTGKPTQWGSDPTEQMAGSDCVLGNGPLGCAKASTIRPPSNDYLTTLGQAEIGGEGVLLHNGQFREDVVDFYIPGRGLDFVWKRSYQSGIDLDGFLGKRWDFSYGAHFIVEYSGPTPIRGKFSRGDCRRDLYDNVSYQSGEHIFTTVPTGYVDLKTAVVTGSSEVRQTKRNGFKQTFDQATGRLKTRADRYGNTISLAYDTAGKLTAVTDTLSRTINLYYGTTADASEGRLTKVTDFASRSVSYEYAYAYSGGPPVLTKVLYPQTDWLDDTTTPDWTVKTNTSRTTQYEYDETYARLTRILDGRGKERLKNIFDVNGRVDYQYNFSTGTVYHDFTWSVTSGKVTDVLWKNRVLSEQKFYFDTTKHLSTKREVKYTPEGGSATWATTLITRGCTCTLPTAVQEPDNGYETFTIDSNGNVTEHRQYYDNSSPYTTTAGSDLVKKAYFAALTSSEFAVCTKIVGPKAFTVTPNESAYAINITYDTSGNPITIDYPNTTNPTQTGHQETRTYNSYGQLLTITRPESLLTTFTYYDGIETPTSNKGYLKEVKVKYRTTIPNELITTYTYSNFGAKTKEKDPLGRETTYVVDKEFLVTQKTTPGPFSYITKYSYNGERALVKEELENRQGTGSRDVNNEWWETRYFFNDGGAPCTKKREISQSGSTITWSIDACRFYDAEIRMMTKRDAREKDTEFTLDERGLVKTKKLAFQGSPQGVFTHYLDSEGKVTRVCSTFMNPGEVSVATNTRALYDVFDRLEYIKDTDSDATSNYKRFYYDLASMVTEVEENAQAGTLLRQTKNYYDELDRLWKRTRGTSEEDATTFEHDKANRRTKVTDDNGQSMRTEFDLASRATKEIKPTLGSGSSGENYVLVDYDLNSNVTKRTAHEVESISPFTSQDFVWEMEYDELRRLTKTTNKGSDGATTPNPVTTVNTYDTRNLVIKDTDVDGVPTEYVYDGLAHRLTTYYNKGGTNPSQIEVRAAFDNAGNVIARRDADTNVTQYAYDDRGNLTKTTHADGDWIEVIYNEAGLPKTKRYGNGASELKKIKYFHDLRQQLTKREVSWTTTPTWTNYDDFKTTEELFSYDAVKRLTKGEDNDTKVTFEFNALDQVTKEKLEINLRSGGIDSWKTEKVTESVWDSTGKRRTSLKYPISAKTFLYTHDALDRVKDISLDLATDKLMVRYVYEGEGLDVLKRERGLDLNAGTANTFRTAYTDDAIERLTEIKHERITTGTTTLRDLDYTWGNGSSGRIFERSTYKVADGAGTLKDYAYAYDKLGRLSTSNWVHPNPDELYSFTVDPTQFLDKIEKTVNMTTTTERDYTKAGDGSLQMTAADSFSCTYDTAGNMVTYGTLNLYYDHENRLVHTHYTSDPSGNLDHWFRYDIFGRSVVEKVSSTNALFYYDRQHIIEETDSSLGLNRLSLFGVKLDEILYSGDTDGSGSLTAHRWPMENHLGSIILVMDDSGVTKSNYTYLDYGEATNSGSEAYPYQFTGRRAIEGIYLLDLRTRVYDPYSGRFLQRDSIGIWGDDGNYGNGYSYVGNDPINTMDPFGLDDCSACLDPLLTPVEVADCFNRCRGDNPTPPIGVPSRTIEDPPPGGIWWNLVNRDPLFPWPPPQTVFDRLNQRDPEEEKKRSRFGVQPNCFPLLFIEPIDNVRIDLGVFIDPAKVLNELIEGEDNQGRLLRKEIVYCAQFQVAF